MIDLKIKEETFGEANDSIAIKKYIHGKEGGVDLDCTGFPDEYIHAGHGVILQGGVYKPQPVDGKRHDLLVGVVVSTTRKEVPSVGVMTGGYINNNALKYPFSNDALWKLNELGIYNQVD